MDYKEKLTKIIYEWVAKTFGQNEADDPSWCIEALAEEIAKHQHEFYWQQELENLKADVENYVNDLDTDDECYGKLTERQMYAIADEIRNSEWYCSIDPIILREYIKHEVKLAKEKGEK